ncbi:MAG: DUF1161 domain-containing protein [Betaproteobacteria bacterium]|nr:DUF1161 domain-containing protein [Betaproteobacteria bacterium]
MNAPLFGVLLALAVSPALARKSCDELKAEIDAKLQEKKVSAYSLEIVDSDQTGDRKVVGSCDGGTKKIVYTREKKLP